MRNHYCPGCGLQVKDTYIALVQDPTDPTSEPRVVHTVGKDPIPTVKEQLEDPNSCVRKYQAAHPGAQGVNPTIMRLEEFARAYFGD